MGPFVRQIPNLRDRHRRATTPLLSHRRGLPPLRPFTRTRPNGVKILTGPPKHARSRGSLVIHRRRVIHPPRTSVARGVCRSVHALEQAPHRTCALVSGWDPTRVAFFPQACRIVRGDWRRDLAVGSIALACVLGSHRTPQSVFCALTPSAFLLSGPLRPPLTRAELARRSGCRVF